MPLDLATQAPLISHITHSGKLLFLQKAAAVRRKGGGGIGTKQTDYSGKCPSPLFSQSSVQKVGAYFLELTVLERCLNYNGFPFFHFNVPAVVTVNIP